MVNIEKQIGFLQEKGKAQHLQSRKCITYSQKGSLVPESQIRVINSMTLIKTVSQKLKSNEYDSILQFSFLVADHRLRQL